MKRCWLAIFLVFCSLASPGWAEDSGARFSDLSGQVEVRPHDDEEAWSFAKLEMILNVDDHIKTAEKSSAILSFADMTTFVMKPESEIILSSPAAKDTQVKLLAGNLWVNVKKMMKDGSMEIEMSQAVAGIKGTNITCSGSEDGNENRVQVLRGIADVLIKETQERISVGEGEELVIKKGQKPEKTDFDPTKVNDEWKGALSNMGSSIDFGDIPETIQGILQKSSEEFSTIMEDFKALAAAEGVSEEVQMEFYKAAERYAGTLMEDLFILSAIRMKIEKTLAAGGTPEQVAQGASYQVQTTNAVNKIQAYQAEVVKFMKSKFKTTAAGSEEATSLQEEFMAAIEPVDGVLREVSGQPSGLPQDWFDEALDLANQALVDLDALAARVSALLDANPNDLLAQQLLKQIGAKQTEINVLLRDLAIVHIDGTVITEMQDIDDNLSEAILLLNNQIELYNTTVHGADAEKRLSASLSILRDFSKSRRLYINAQRLFDSIMRSTAGQKFKTAEQEEIEGIYDRIANTYQQIGIGAEQLETRLQELESQLGQFLR